MELNSNPSPTSQASGDLDNVNTNVVKLTEPAPDLPLNTSSKNNGIDLGNEQGSELDESSDTENSSRSNDEDQSSETDFTPIQPGSFTEDMEVIIKNQHKYYLYCPCCGEDITKTVKLVKKSDPKPIKFSENKEKGKIENEVNSLGSSKKEKDNKPSFPRWFIDVVAWLLLCTVIVLSIFFTSPMKLQPIFPEQLQLLSMPSLQLPSASVVLLLLPMFAVLFMALRFGYSLRFQGEKGDKRVDSKSSNDTIKEESDKDQVAVADEDYVKRKENQKVHPNPVDSLPEEEEVNKETHEQNTEAEETVLQPNISTNFESCKGSSSNKIEILKSMVYGGLTESITSLCTVTSAAASGASTLNVLALGVANLSSGLLLIVHNLQELINEKSRRGANTTEEDRYEQVLGRREKFRFHSVVVISSFLLFGVIPPLVYGFSFRTSKKEEEYKILTVYGASLVCVALLSLGKAYVEKRGEYLKTLFRYTTMATTASGFSQFVGYFVSNLLEKYRFYDGESSQTPAH